MSDAGAADTRTILALRRVVRLELEAGTPREVLIGALEAVKHSLGVEMQMGAGESDGGAIYRGGEALWRRGRRGRRP